MLSFEQALEKLLAAAKPVEEIRSIRFPPRPLMFIMIRTSVAEAWSSPSTLCMFSKARRI